MILDNLTDLIQKNKEYFLSSCFDLLRFPSISANSDFKGDVVKCAQYLKEHFDMIGATRSQMFFTDNHPIVYSEFHVSEELPTLLIYGHYDVQPPDPLDKWDTPPFEPTIKDDFIYARGSADDKGQIMAHIKAVETILKYDKNLPVNIKFIIEGEEEIGSQNLPQFLKDHGDLLSSDIVLISDSPMYGDDQPSISMSIRGMLYSEVIVTGPKIDLHSGQFGGIIQNPIQALSKIVSLLKDKDDNVLIPGFYDHVSSIPQLDEYSKKICAEADSTLAICGVSSLVGDGRFSPYERKWFRPTLDCNGFVGGYIGEGAKTIIPSQASAKISMRLVSNQDPVFIKNQFESYIKSITPDGVNVQIKTHSLAHPARMNDQSLFFKYAKESFFETYHKPPLVVGEGGTIPVIADFQKILGLDTIMMGFNLPDDGIHSPNERFGVSNYLKGIETAIRFYFKSATC